MKSKNSLVAKIAKVAAESALKRDANNTTCFCLVITREMRL